MVSSTCLKCVTEAVQTAAFSAYQEDSGKVDVVIKKDQEGFCFWVTKAHVVLEDFGSAFCEHQTYKKNAHKRETCKKFLEYERLRGPLN